MMTLSPDRPAVAPPLASRADSSLLSVSNLTVAFGAERNAGQQRTVIRGIDLDIRRGEILGRPVPCHVPLAIPA